MTVTVNTNPIKVVTVETPTTVVIRDSLNPVAITVSDRGAGPTGPGGPAGATGATGAAGPAGVSVTNANVQSGNLVLTLSNSATIDAGTVSGGGGNANTGNIKFAEYVIYSDDETSAIIIDPSHDNGESGYITIPGPGGANADALIIENQLQGGVEIRSYNETWRFANSSIVFPLLSSPRGDTRTGSVYGQTLRFGDSTHEVVIGNMDGDETYQNAQRIVINPGKGADGTYGEGGDIYLWAGRGGDAGGSGGDIKVRGGYGPSTGDGGYIRIDGGDTQTTGSGGYVYITGGSSPEGAGGDVTLRAGDGASSGKVEILTNSASKSWSFQSNGNMYFPDPGRLQFAPNTWIGWNDGDSSYLEIRSGVGATNDSYTVVDQQTTYWEALTEVDRGGDNYSSWAWIHTGWNSGNTLQPQVFIETFQEGNTNRWNFDHNGTLTLPDVPDVGGKISCPSQIILDAAGTSALTVTGSSANITTDLSGTPKTWTFDDAGHLKLPANGDFSHIYGATDKSLNFQTTGTTTARVQVTQTDGIKIYANNDAHLWQFDNAGDLTLPGNTFAVKYANGEYVQLSGSYGDSNVQLYILTNNVATKEDVIFIRDEGFGNVAYFGITNPDSETLKIRTNISAGDLNTDIITIDRQTQNVLFSSLVSVGSNVVANTSTIFVGNSTVNSSITSSAARFGNTTVAGILYIEDGVHETFQTKQDATGTVTHDCSLGHIFYHTSPDANWTANFTNLNLANNTATSLTLVVSQGGTGYFANAVQIGGVSQTLNWVNNVTPTPSTNRVDVITFSILNVSGTYTVLGQLSGF